MGYGGGVRFCFVYRLFDYVGFFVVVEIVVVIGLGE